MLTKQARRVLLGEAGEHLVVSRLLGLGYVAGQLPRTYRADDVYVECRDRQVIHFQVKTTQQRSLNWPVSGVDQDAMRFYAFVHMLSPMSPAVYVLSSAAVKSALATHEEVYTIDHHSTNPGVPTLADAFRSPRIVNRSYPKGWLKEYLEAWGQLPPPD
jgi:hypothetical protein